MKRSNLCVLCNGVIPTYPDGFVGGHNPFPLATKGQCCDACNRQEVIPARIALLDSQTDRALPETDDQGGNTEAKPPL